MEPWHERLDMYGKKSIAWRVQSGFYTSEEIVENVSEGITYDATNVALQEARRAVRAIVAVEWAAQKERQESWPNKPTTSEKLAKAFSSLERNHKILARMNFTCCQTCGIEELDEDRDDDTRGYVFFHEQDTESAVDTGELFLAYGSFTKSEKKNLIIGDTVAKSLRCAGLKVEWEQETNKRITVHCGQWRSRFKETEDMEDVADDDFDTDCMSSGESTTGPEPDTLSDLDLDEEPDNAG